MYICHLTIVKEIFVLISHCSEKANLAVTLSTTKNEVLAHASFSDHPTEELVDQACWENLLQSHVNGEKFTVSEANKPRCLLLFNIYIFFQPTDSLVSLFFQPMNTLFLRLFVAQPGFSIGGAKEIVR